jgi:TRAP-type C4-dicarboxylate transport system permease small subunit
MPANASRSRPHAIGLLSLVCDLVETLLGWLAGLGLAAFVVTVLIDVIYREILERPLFAPSEISVCLFVWSTLLAAAVAGRRNAHFVMDFLPASIPPKLDFALKLLAALLAVAFACVLTYYGYAMADRGWMRVSPMSGFSMLWFYTAMPVAGSAFLLFTTEKLVLTLTEGAGKVTS